eukprot:gene3129-13141_t
MHQHRTGTFDHALALVPPIRTPTSNTKSARDEIEEFLLALPLGEDAESAEVEQLVAERLYDVESEKQELTNKVHQWADVAVQLRQMLEQQKLETQRLQEQYSNAAATESQLLPAVAASAAALTASMMRGKQQRESGSVDREGGNLAKGTAAGVQAAHSAVRAHQAALSAATSAAQLSAAQDSTGQFGFTPESRMRGATPQQQVHDLGVNEMC